ncbi:uncharacterized protein LY89DRAFT_743429 [Mollisia scopiformis]|uniref:2EXR domain-containing protein n=1 Tax=Mollisia scopiformis TaxID=149040 RepID=A0A132B382_MOLSC|nr:uncharacterized protein LY89DRAFT_743429 [Mollisia scopiformis]KUJ06791.1 hypothetical protein LY89DRAFT_743429 [Mollisia scopiformis]
MAIQSASSALGSLTEFTCFPELPAELRLMIWRLTFPKERKVGLLMMTFTSTKKRKSLHSKQLNEPLPVSLHINHESRIETLTHYQIFYRSDVGDIEPLAEPYDRPLCVNTTLDTLVLPVDLALLGCESEYYKSEYTAWMTYLDNNLDGGLKSVRYLRIAGHIGFRGEEALKAIECFQGLQVLTVSLDMAYAAAASLAIKQLMIDRRRKQLEEWYKVCQEKMIDFHIPRIILEVDPGRDGGQYRLRFMGA